MSVQYRQKCQMPECTIIYVVQSLACRRLPSEKNNVPPRRHVRRRGRQQRDGRVHHLDGGKEGGSGLKVVQHWHDEAVVPLHTQAATIGRSCVHRCIGACVWMGCNSSGPAGCKGEEEDSGLKVLQRRRDEAVVPLHTQAATIGRVCTLCLNACIWIGCNM